jgi:hypothetical protein
MNSILHIYKVDVNTSNEFVDENFKQRFFHIHIDKNTTYLIRMIDYIGKKLDYEKDADEIMALMEEYDKNCPAEIKKVVTEFLNKGNKKNEHASSDSI